MRASPNFDVLKEPRGFIKCLEIFLAIFAFACVTGYTGTIGVNQQNYGHKTTDTFKYPFEDPLELTLQIGKTNTTITSVWLTLDQRASPEFFVVIGVFCFLYSLVMLIYYIFFEEDNSRNATPSSNFLSAPVIDFGLGSFWALFWFFSACAFAAALGAIKDATDIVALKESNAIIKAVCSEEYADCSVTKANYATLTVAALLGFLNVFVWAGNLWFLWKETPWHNSRTAQPAATVQQQSQQTPQAAAI